MTHNPKQIEASDPRHSVWVSASAGTGKTKVLTDRVLRLLLEGVSFEKILCLTFTNAAANEMLCRILDVLLLWQKDTTSLATILGRKPSDIERVNASKLFSAYIVSSHQLSIHTIHSFAQKILQKFPLEAGLYPGFKILDSIETSQIMDLVMGDIIHLLKSPKDCYLNESLSFLLQNLHESLFKEIISEIIGDKIYFKNLFKQFHSEYDYAQFLSIDMGLSGGISRELERIWNVNIDIINDYIRKKDFEAIKAFFLTSTGQPRKKLLNKKEKDADASLESRLLELQEIVWKIDQYNKKSKMLDATTRLFALAKYIIERYTYHKSIKGGLDYDDLIYYTDELLNNSSVRDWVLYKLDGGIDHLLVDEAQDTSPEQWKIISAIMQEFYSGSAGLEKNRTLFVVGDEKQSIYSFQGADVENFVRFNRYIESRMIDGLKAYSNVNLEWSYRSSYSVTSFVKCFLEKYKISDIESNTKCFRENSIGCVELWPLYKIDEEGGDLFWPKIDDMKSNIDASQKLAEDIALYIKNYINSGKVLSSTGEPVNAGDFMILLRKRGAFMGKIVDSLKKYGVEVGGVDRLVLADHISVKDILSILRYISNPMDELNFAALLKSPLLGLLEAELKELILGGVKYENPVLDSLISISQNTSLFEFLYILIELMNFREILVKSNGESTNDVLDELLNLSADFSRKFGSNIQEFIYWIEKHNIEIKRDISSKGTVKVMTIHGAKGLEAPIVILPDTTSIPSEQKSIIWRSGLMYWVGSGVNSNEYYEELKDKVNNSLMREYLRILYVAFTRAEDHLIICGSSTGRKIDDGCFYNVASEIISSMSPSERMSGIKYIGENIEFEDGAYLQNESQNFGLRLDCDKERLQLILSQKKKVCNYTYNPIATPLYSRISMNYGEFLHKILEDSVKTGNFDFSPEHPMISSLEGEERLYVISKIEKIFLMKDFIDLIKFTKIYTEISVGYNLEGQIKIGRIDLLSIGDENVTIIDYKTDKKYPENHEDIPNSYKEQLQRYSSAISKIYPNHKVVSKILWVEGAIMMDVI